MSRLRFFSLSLRSFHPTAWPIAFFAILAACPCLLAAPEQPQQAPADGLNPPSVSLPPVLRLDPASSAEDYQIGADDMLDISVFEAPDLNRTARVSGIGEITYPPLGIVKVGGLTARQLELTLEGLLRRTYVRNPHVVVFVREVQSHPVFVFGLVAKPGMYQLRGARSLVEVLSLAGGVLQNAGDSVVVVRGQNLAFSAERKVQDHSTDRPEAGDGAADSEEMAAKAPGKIEEPETQIIRVSLREVLESGRAVWDVPIYPGDIVTVPPPLLVYFVGEVSKPGGYPYKNDETLWQMLAVAGGPTGFAAKGKSRIIRVDPKTGQRTEIPVDLNKILMAKNPGPPLKPNDILYVPAAVGRRAMDRALMMAWSTTPGLIVAFSTRP